MHFVHCRLVNALNHKTRSGSKRKHTQCAPKRQACNACPKPHCKWWEEVWWF